MRGTFPPCGDCLPSIMDSNNDAWEVYQLACMDSMGISAQGVIEIAKVLNVEDITETLYKVSELAKTFRILNDEKRKMEGK